MPRWMPVPHITPPDCFSILLYVVEWDEKELIHEVGDEIITGHYNHSDLLFYYDLLNQEPIAIESETIKVVAWAFGPEINRKLIKLKREMEQWKKEIRERIDT